MIVCACGNSVPKGERCACKQKRDQAYEKQRGSAADRGYNRRWQKASRLFLQDPRNWYCACGCGRMADLVDHKIAHKGDKALFWDKSNWQPMAKGCNSRKAAATEGGFGNPRR